MFVLECHLFSFRLISKQIRQRSIPQVVAGRKFLICIVDSLSRRDLYSSLPEARVHT
jgi:hypothetical protein